MVMIENGKKGSLGNKQRECLTFYEYESDIGGTHSISNFSMKTEPSFHGRKEKRSDHGHTLLS